MKLKYILLDHPFYQAWTMGEVTVRQLSEYSASYNEFIQRIPDYWQRIIDGFKVKDPMGMQIVNEEVQHAFLWEKWSQYLPIPGNFPHLDEIVNAFETMTTSELLGAIHAFEIQQPEVALTKKEGLLKHYGFKENELDYFNEHFDEEKHYEFGLSVMEQYADKEEFQRGFDRGSELIYRSLDLFN